VLRVGNLDEALAFYRGRLGHRLLWRTERSAGLAMVEDGAELVLSTDLDPQTDLLVDSVERAVAAFTEAGGTVVSPPSDIPVGKVAVVEDPFGNRLVLLDTSKGRYAAGSDGNVTGIA
jgi:hypothetical protein